MMTKAPAHVAIIMDGNGRWAKQRALPRIRGHQIGADRVLEIVRAASEFGVRYLTLYSFSKENWERPPTEVEFLMNLLTQHLDKQLAELRKNGVVFNTIGDLKDLPQKIQERIERNKEETKSNTGLVLTLALSYSSRDELTKACRRIAEEVRDQKLDPETISEKTISEHLFTANLPDPDLLIRTSGEMRISNFLLWQISYTELYVTDTYWPDFTKEEFRKAIESFGHRERRFGRTEPPGMMPENALKYVGFPFP